METNQSQPTTCGASSAPGCSASWLPMDTAPKDGTEILAWRKDCGRLLVRWTCCDNFLSDAERNHMSEEDSAKYDWFCADFVAGSRLDIGEEPTHWMPLPDEPNASIWGEGFGYPQLEPKF